LKKGILKKSVLITQSTIIIVKNINALHALIISLLKDY